MRLHVANCTPQDMNVPFRLIESKRPHVQSILAGKQAIIGGLDISTPQVEHLLEQLRPYGLKLVEELNGAPATAVVEMVASLDRPVSFEIIQSVVEHNRGAQFLRGKKFREEAAIAASEEIGRVTPDAADTLKVSVQEETPGTGGDGQTPVNEGWHITRKAAA